MERRRRVDAPGLRLMQDRESKQLDPNELKIDPVNERVSNTGLHSEEDKALKESIRENGVLEPIVVREVDDIYLVVAGQRRTLAAQEVGVDSIRARVMEMDTQEARLVSVTENADQYKKDVLPEDRAVAIKKLIEDGFSIEKIAERMGCSTPTVKRWLEPTHEYWEDTDFGANPKSENESPLEDLSLTSMRIIRENTSNKEQGEIIVNKVLENNMKVELVREARDRAEDTEEFEQEIEQIITRLDAGVQRISEKIRFTGQDAEKIERIMKNRGVGEKQAIEMLVSERLKKLEEPKQKEVVEIYLPKNISDILNEILDGSNITMDALCRSIIKSKLEDTGYL